MGPNTFFRAVMVLMMAVILACGIIVSFVEKSPVHAATSFAIVAVMVAVTSMEGFWSDVEE